MKHPESLAERPQAASPSESLEELVSRAALRLSRQTRRVTLPDRLEVARLSVLRLYLREADRTVGVDSPRFVAACRAAERGL